MGIKAFFFLSGPPPTMMRNSSPENFIMAPQYHSDIWPFEDHIFTVKMRSSKCFFAEK